VHVCATRLELLETQAGHKHVEPGTHAAMPPYNNNKMHDQGQTAQLC
jgi:hypothetical protein